MKILCLFVRYGTTQYPNALETLDRWYSRHGLRDDRTLWIIDNQRPELPPELIAPNTRLFSGDNSSWEFSAWERVLRENEDQVLGYDFIHFVTSAFDTLYTKYLEHFSADLLQFAAARDICLGHIDGYHVPVDIAGYRSQWWIRTCFFFIRPDLALKIPTWAVHEDPTLFFANPEQIAFRPDAPLSENYRNNITLWLTGKEMGGHKWHSPVATKKGEAARFQLKALAILNEHQLSISLRQAQIALVDFCWLWTRGSDSELLQSLPLPEESQIAVRRRILGIEPSVS